MPESARRIALDSCLYWNRKKCNIHACVVMPTHVHLLMTPVQKDEDSCYNLSEILHSIKSYSSEQLNRLLGYSGPFWLGESFDRLIRSESDLYEKWNYIRNNPVKSELTEKPVEYPFLFECFEDI